MIGIATITSKGQVTIPAEIREYLNLKTADRLLFLVADEKMVVEPIKKNISDLYGAVKTKKKITDFKKIRKAFIKAMAERVVSEME